MSDYTHTANGRTWRLYGCAKRGCDRINCDYESFQARDKGYCLDHIPLLVRLRLRLRRGPSVWGLKKCPDIRNPQPCRSPLPWIAR